MRLLVIAVLVAVLPVAAGWRATRGWVPGRLVLGGLVGVVAGMLGAYAGAFVHQAAVGAAGGLVLVAVASRRWRIPVAAPAGRLELAALAAVAAVSLALVAMAPLRPVPGWDAVAIWSLKAKAVAAFGGYDNPVFLSAYYGFSHQDYPPVLSAWLSLGRSLGGDLTVSWVGQWMLAWLGAWVTTAAVLLAARWRAVAALVVLSFVLAPTVVRQLPMGYADAPAALLLLVGAVLLLQDERPTWAAALLLATAALVKNEATVFAGSLLVGSLATSALRRRAATCLAAVVVAVAPWLVFTRLHGIANDTVTPATLSPGRALHLAGARLPTILASVGGELLPASAWALTVVAVVVLLAVYPWRGVPVAGAALAWVAMVAVYVITPMDLHWHLSSSADRVVLGPMALTIAMAAAAAAGEPRQRARALAEQVRWLRPLLVRADGS